VADGPLRLSGWKAIAAYYGRDRSTVLRWAKAADFPVRRVPGSKGGSVYAYAHELDAWLAKRGSSSEAGVAEGPPVVPELLASSGPPAIPLRRMGARVVVATMIAGLAILGAGVVARFAIVPRRAPSPAAAQALPRAPSLTSLYLQGRDDWATRTPAGLRKAIAELSTVTSREPRFAPAHAGLADAFLLSCEFDNMPQVVAFSKAAKEAQVALAIDPDSIDANRALGFIAYWGSHDVDAARRYFLHALTAGPANAQAHFWYGNILMDNGEIAPGYRELQTARMLDPGSAAIQADYAWASWQRGSGDEGIADLEALEARAPTLETPILYLALIEFADDDVADYIDHGERWAALQGDAALRAQMAAERAAFRKGGGLAVLDLIATSPPVAITRNREATLFSAGAASFARRRGQLQALLARAETHGEHWNPTRFERTLFARWRDDPAISSRLNRLFAPEAGYKSLASHS